MYKYGVFSGPYFPAFELFAYLSVFSPNALKYGPEKTPYLDNFHAVFWKLIITMVLNITAMIVSITVRRKSLRSEKF